MYDLVIIGGGPAGIAAGVYAARKKMKTVLIAKEFGGQSLVSADIQNWIGTKSLSGLELAERLEAHLRAQKEIEIVEDDLVEKVEKSSGGFAVTTKNGKNFETKTILVCSGSRRRRLGIPGEDRLDGKGIVWCSTCDAPLFNEKDVAVVGAGNAGLEAVRDLFPYANKVYLLNRGDKIRGDAVTFEGIKKNPKLEIMMNAEPKEFLGDVMLTGLRYVDKASAKEKELNVQGVFIEIGSLPNVEFLGDLVKRNKFNEIVVDAETQMSSQPGIWAAGDASSVFYKQNNISAGDAIKAVLNIDEYLHNIKRK